MQNELSYEQFSYSYRIFKQHKLKVQCVKIIAVQFIKHNTIAFEYFFTKIDKKNRHRLGMSILFGWLCRLIGGSLWSSDSRLLDDLFETVSTFRIEKWYCYLHL